MEGKADQALQSIGWQGCKELCQAIQKEKKRGEKGEKKSQEMGKERKKGDPDEVLFDGRWRSMEGARISGSADQRNPSVGLKSTKWVVGPSNTAQHLNSQEQNSKRSVVGPDIGTFPKHQIIQVWDQDQEGAGTKLKVKSVLFSWGTMAIKGSSVVLLVSKSIRFCFKKPKKEILKINAI